MAVARCQIKWLKWPWTLGRPWPSSPAATRRKAGRGGVSGVCVSMICFVSMGVCVSMSVFESMSVSMGVFVYMKCACVRAHTHTNTHKHTRKRARVHMHARTHARTHTRALSLTHKFYTTQGLGALSKHPLPLPRSCGPRPSDPTRHLPLPLSPHTPTHTHTTGVGRPFEATPTATRHPLSAPTTAEPGVSPLWGAGASGPRNGAPHTSRLPVPDGTFSKVLYKSRLCSK
jgi:hypothetical protein